MFNRTQFITWYAEPDSLRPGKMNKYPCDWRTGRRADAHDPTIWTDFETAKANAGQWDHGHGFGAGFVFTLADPYFFLDIDHALLTDGGLSRWSDQAIALCAAFPHAYIEVSQSGTGLHVIASYAGPPPAHGTRNVPLGLELYTSRRFVALTGSHAQGSPETDHTLALWKTAADLFPPVQASAQAERDGLTTEPCEGYGGPPDDDELIRLACLTKSAGAAFGKGVSFVDLWHGDPVTLARVFPPDGAGLYNASSADMALANHLAFWTGKHGERMERLMRRSALVREKWDSSAHAGYVERTIRQACAFTRSVAAGAPVKSGPVPTVAMAPIVEAGNEITSEILTPYAQVDHFRDLAYVRELNQVLEIPSGMLLSRPQFDVVYGGHGFVMDGQGQKTTHSAWEAFTENRINRPLIVSDIAFRPELANGALITEGDQQYVNSYVPYDCVIRDDEPTLFLDWLSRILPVESDRESLLDYLAWCAQVRGKVQWWPVVQGTPGNGKTLLVRAMAYVHSARYCHLPNAAALARDGMKFNSWIERKLFIGIEEVALAGKRDFLEEFKPVVTNERMPMEGKNVNARTGDNRSNGIICTNHKDGVPITMDERRYLILFTAQQSAADIIRDGMGGDYFPNLYDWFYGRGVWAEHGPNYGVSCIAGWLKRRVVRELPQRAPNSSSKPEALTFSMGRAEQEIIEAMQDGSVGFQGGWVSGHYLDLLLKSNRITVAHAKRTLMMESLGYVPHPKLVDGRTDNVVMPDNRRSRLFIRIGHPAMALERTRDIGKAYAQAQDTTASDGRGVVIDAATAFANRPLITEPPVK